jgi:hypothetical protein
LVQCFESRDESVCASEKRTVPGNPDLYEYHDYCWNPDSLENRIRAHIENGNVSDLYDDSEAEFPFTQGPVFHCSQFDLKKSLFTVYYRWELGHHAQTLHNLTQ